jgi:hypothetical protein
MWGWNFGFSALITYWVTSTRPCVKAKSRSSWLPIEMSVQQVKLGSLASTLGRESLNACVTM